MIITKITAVAAALSLGMLAFTGSADAHWHGGGGVAAGGIIGFAAGAMVGNALAQPRVVVVQPGYYYGYPDWVSYCMARHHSYNPNTGLYFGRDGYYHECR